MAFFMTGTDLPANTDNLTFTGFQVMGQIAIMGASVGFRHQHIDIITNHFFGFVTQNLFRRAIVGLHNTGCGHLDNAIHCSIKHRL